jgi:hypothetical protein
MKVIIVKINVSSAISCLTPLIIAVIVSVAMHLFVTPQMKTRGETIQLPIGQLHDNLKLTDRKEALRE